MSQGSVFRRKNSQYWWIKFYRSGKPYRESSGSTRLKDAKRLLAKRQGAVATGTFTGLQPEKTTFDEIAQTLLDDYTINQKKALPQLGYYIERLRRDFGGMKVVNITTDRILAYIARRKKEETHLGAPPANATINRELAALKRMLNLGRRHGKVVAVTYVPQLEENNVRAGFFHHWDYLEVEGCSSRLSETDCYDGVLYRFATVRDPQSQLGSDRLPSAHRHTRPWQYEKQGPSIRPDERRVIRRTQRSEAHS